MDNLETQAILDTRQNEDKPNKNTTQKTQEVEEHGLHQTPRG